jgi:hypothetical protein
MADVSWQLLEGIGAYVAHELSGEDAGRMERFVWEDDEAQRLTGSYARLLTLLKAVGEEAPEMPEAVIDRAD